jgi:tryptophan synthase beta chain
LHASGRASYRSVTDAQALEALALLSRTEGIIPALETAHALAVLPALVGELGPDALIVLNLSGRGDKDMHTVMERLDPESLQVVQDAKDKRGAR